jgi:hypothetical protein
MGGAEASVLTSGLTPGSYAAHLRDAVDGDGKAGQLGDTIRLYVDLEPEAVELRLRQMMGGARDVVECLEELGLVAEEERGIRPGDLEGATRRGAGTDPRFRSNEPGVDEEIAGVLQ